MRILANQNNIINQISVNNNRQATNPTNYYSSFSTTQRDNLLFFNNAYATNISFKGINEKEVAKTFVFDAKQNRKVLVTITHQTLRDERARIVDEYKVYTRDKEKKFIGYIKLIDSKRKENVLLQFAKTYGSKRQNYLFIDEIESIPEGYKGIGATLMQFAVEQSIKKGYKGRLKLIAGTFLEGTRQFEYDCKVPVGFYFDKCHFRVDKEDNPDSSFKDEEIQEKIKQAKESNVKIEDLDFDAIWMYLPEKEIKNFWMPKIEEKPIVLTPNELQKL